MGEFSPWHMLIVAVVFMALFGAKRLPDAARSLGRSMRILKAETAGLRGDQDESLDWPGQPAQTQVRTALPVPTTYSADPPAMIPDTQATVRG